MPSQEGYSLIRGNAAARPGMRLDSGRASTMSKTASAQIDFGAAVQRTGDQTCGPLVAGGKFLGVVIGGHKMPAVGGYGHLYAGDSYFETENASILDNGTIWALADGSIATGQAVNWNSTNRRWTSSAPGGNIVATPGCDAESDGLSGSLFRLRVRRGA